MLCIYHAADFCNFNVPCRKRSRTASMLSLDLYILHLITGGLLGPFWAAWAIWIICTFLILRCVSWCETCRSLFCCCCCNLTTLIKFSGNHYFIAYNSVPCVAFLELVRWAGYPSPSPSPWLVATLIRGDRNGTWPLLLCGWSFPLPRGCWRLGRACRSEVCPFLTPAQISQTVIAPGRSPVWRRWRSW